MTSSCRQNKGQIILINNSNEPVKLAHIEICKQVIEIENLKPHEQAIGNFKIRGDSHYDIVIKFASGKEIKKQTGYVTSGFDFQHDTLSITETDIAIIDSKAK
jgi:hypothetical protein